MDSSLPDTVGPDETNPEIAVPPTPPPDPPMEVDAEEKQEYSFEYELRNWERLEETKVYSPFHEFAGFTWRLLIFPSGNQADTDISVYLECGGPVPPSEPAAPAVAKASDKKDASRAVPENDAPSPPKAHAERGDTELALEAEDRTMTNAPDSDDLEPTEGAKKLETDTQSDVKEPLSNDLKTAPRTAPPAELEDDDTLEHPVKEPGSQPFVPQTWSRCARFWLSLKRTPNTPHRAATVSKEVAHTFREKETDWGFREFCKTGVIRKDRYTDESGSLCICVRIKLEEPSPEAMYAAGTWDSRKETGYVGFKNQGATCYMNSLLQTLYMLGAFRRAVYQMPLPSEENPDQGGSRMSYALQKVFYELQYSATTVRTKKLTESFGWDTADAFTQHDVQELNRILCDHLEERMKKISPDEPNTISQLFEGKSVYYVTCINVDFESIREEKFYDISLTVKGCRNIYESFDKYTEVQILDGDNKYRADGHGLQDAKRGVRFAGLPPVLQLHLNRGEYDPHRDTMVKINDRFEFATEIDLSPYVEKSDGRDIYILHAVLVHVGDVNGGHYYAYIRPTAKPVSNTDGRTPTTGSLPSTWYLFDDDKVAAATEEQAVMDNFGSGGERDTSNLNPHPRFADEIHANLDLNGAQTPPKDLYPQSRMRGYAGRRISNAYMLQYVRKDQAEALLTAPKDNDVPKALSDRIVDEQREEERRKRDNLEQHLYMNVAVATDRDLAEHTGVDIVDWTRVKQVRVKRATLLKELKHLLQDEGIVSDARTMRLWKCVTRANSAFRPESLLARGDNNSPISDRARDLAALQQTQYSVGYHNPNRYYGMQNDDLLRLYVEDFASPHCYGAGAMFSRAVEQSPQLRMSHAIDRSYTHSAQPLDAKDPETDAVPGTGVDKRLAGEDGRNVLLDKFDLVEGEMLLFLKRYIPGPQPRLEWAGHCIVDCTVPVKSVVPLLLETVRARRGLEPSTPPIEADARLRVFEEVAPDEVKELDPNKSFMSQLIPEEPGEGGDILVFMGSSTEEERVESDGAGLRPYNPSLPLGGRPMPTPFEYYVYLNSRVKVEFKNKYPAVDQADIGANGVVLELLRDDSYALVRDRLASALGEGYDADRIRLFHHDFSREGPALEAVRCTDSDELHRMLYPQTHPGLHGSDFRILWYERTEYAISEYENKEEVRVMWRPDGGCNSTPHEGVSESPGSSPTAAGTTASDPSDVMVDVSNESDPDATLSTGPLSEVAPDTGVKVFSVLVPIGAKFDEVAAKVRQKVGLEESSPIRFLDIRGFRVSRFVDPAESVSRSTSGLIIPEFGEELRAEPVSEEELGDVSAEDATSVSVCHILKDNKPRSFRFPVYFGHPLIIRISKEGETVGAIRERLRRRMGVPDEVFATWKLAEVSQVKVSYLEDFEQPWAPDRKVTNGVEVTCLALEHRGSVPVKRPNAAALRYADKPLKIRG